MKIKKTFLVLVALIVGSVSVHASCPGTNPSLHQQYLCKRYVTITQVDAKYKIDFNQVQLVFTDGNGNSKSLSPPSDAPPSNNHIYVVFNNGTWMAFGIPGTAPNPLDAWDAYRDFLIGNPSFIRY